MEISFFFLLAKILCIVIIKGEISFIFLVIIFFSFFLLVVIFTLMFLDSSGSHNRSSTDVRKTSIHVMALDEMLGANSLAMAAVLVGLFVTPSLVVSNNPLSSCSADHDRARNLIVFEVISFSCFLFSSFVTLVRDPFSLFFPNVKFV